MPTASEDSSSLALFDDNRFGGQFICGLINTALFLLLEYKTVTMILTMDESNCGRIRQCKVPYFSFIFLFIIGDDITFNFISFFSFCPPPLGLKTHKF